MAFLKRIPLLFLILAFAPAVQAADNLQLQDQEIKAALLYNFLKYTDWPAGASSAHTSSIVVCVFGDDPFGGYLQPMAGRNVNQKEIALRTLHKVPDTGNCNLLFINADEKERWPQLRDFLSGKNVLTVSDFDGFAAAGGMIEFGHRDNHISAALNMEPLTAAKLHVQDRLLKLVTIMQPSPQAETH